MNKRIWRFIGAATAAGLLLSFMNMINPDSARSMDQHTWMDRERAELRAVWLG